MSGGFAISALKTQIRKLRAEKAELIDALKVADDADEHWFNDAADGCQDCDRDDGAPCDEQMNMDDKAREVRKAVLAKFKV